MNSFIFNPMSEEELIAINLIEPGIYNFEVTKSTRKFSKSGNPMAEIQLKIWDKEGKTHIIYDYLVFSNIPLNIKKIKRFCDAVGLHEEYKKGEIPELLDGKSGSAEIGIKEPQPNENGGFYARKNIVLDYSKGSDISKTKPSEEPFNDNIPF